MKKKPSKSKLIKKLDAIFSIYLRRKHADGQGMVACYTCSKILPWKEIQCGHFCSRKHFSTRWYTPNCRPQCVGCNVFSHGNMPVYAANLIKECGPDIVDELVMKSKQTTHFDAYDYEVMIQEFESLTEKL